VKERKGSELEKWREGNERETERKGIETVNVKLEGKECERNGRKLRGKGKIEPSVSLFILTVSPPFPIHSHNFHTIHTLSPSFTYSPLPFHTLSFTLPFLYCTPLKSSSAFQSLNISPLKIFL